eukprot:TRINITY_DN1651_c0_g1_i1.p1 TRINITY_DN1651_c0_g1~~TRINITY_DN1651_c0_g1_i1.p1  ORF type:complete len:1096 (+),score=235.94 TRINITY_DN1651_c0_g1_i1:28-3288(+)
MEVGVAWQEALLDLLPCGETVHHKCFHGTKPIAYLASRCSVLAFDLVSGLALGRVRVEQGTTIQFVVHTSHCNILCALCQDGTVCAWDAETFTWVGTFTPYKDEEKREFTCFTTSKLSPFLFYSKANTKCISVVDLVGKASFKLKGGKKPIMSIAAHPLDFVLASCSADYEVKLWDFENQSCISTVDNCLPSADASSYFLSFDACGSHLIVGSQSGHICVWDTPQGSTNYGFFGRKELGESFTDMTFHPQIPLLFTLNIKSELQAWEPAKELVLQKSGFLRSDANKLEADCLASRTAAKVACTDVAGCGSLPALQACIIQRVASSAKRLKRIIFHPTLHFFTFLYDESTPPTEPMGAYLSNCVNVYEIVDRAATGPGALCPLRQPTPECLFFSPHAFCITSPYLYFLSENFIMGYSVVQNDLHKCVNLELLQSCWPQFRTPAEKQQAQSRSLSLQSAQTSFTRPIKLLHSEKQNVFVVLFETLIAGYSTARGYCIVSCDRAAIADLKLDGGRDVALCGDNEEGVIIVSEDGTTVKLGDTMHTPEGLMQLWLLPGYTALNVFSSPLENSQTVLFYCEEKGSAARQPKLIMASPRTKFSPLHSLLLKQNESVIQVKWQQGRTLPNNPLTAVLTTSRILVLDATLKILRTLASLADTPLFFCSIYWAGWSVLFSTETAVKYLCLDGRESTLLSLNSMHKPVVCGILPDRLLVGSTTVPVAAHGLATAVVARPTSLLEPLLFGEVAWLRLLAPHLLSPANLPALKERFVHLFSRYEWARISQDVVNITKQLQLPDLVWGLTRCSPFLDPEQQFDAALRVHDYKAALNLLSAKLQSVSETGHPAKDSDLYNAFLKLAEVCMLYGQFETVKKCYEVLGDPHLLMLFFANTKNARGLKQLQQSLTDPALSATCQQLLKALPENAASLENMRFNLVDSIKDIESINSFKVGAYVGDCVIPKLKLDNANAWFAQPLLKLESPSPLLFPVAAVPATSLLPKFSTPSPTTSPSPATSPVPSPSPVPVAAATSVAELLDFPSVDDLSDLCYMTHPEAESSLLPASLVGLTTGVREERLEEAHDDESDNDIGAPTLILW